MPKRCEKRSYEHIRVVVSKKALTKTHKLNSLGQKLKMPKRCEKQSYDHSGVVVSKNALQKKPNTGKTRGI